MSFQSWCGNQVYTAREHAAAVYQTCLRLRLRREADAYRARLFAEVERRMNALGSGIARDIREWRVEA